MHCVDDYMLKFASPKRLHMYHINLQTVVKDISLIVIKNIAIIFFLLINAFSRLGYFDFLHAACEGRHF